LFLKTTAALALAATGLVQAGTFQTDFSTDPGGEGYVNRPGIMTLLTNSQLTLINLNDLVDEFGVFQPSRLPLQASYVFPEIDPGSRVESFTATFKVRMGGGTENPAQGFSLVLAKDYDGSLFREAGGTTTGLTISFDTYNSEAPPPGTAGATEGNVPGDAPGIIVKQGGNRVLAKRFGGLRTDPAGTNHAPVFVTVQVKLDPDGTLDVTYNGTNVYDNVPIGYIPIAGRFGFGSGTEEQTIGNRDNVTIDDVNIVTTNVVGASIASVSPPVLDARPDAAIVIEIADLGGGATALQFDNTPVSPSTMTAGNITTLTYQPPALLTPGSTHTVNLTYGTKTLSYAFTVINATIIPPSAAALAGSVNTNNSGFRVRTHQTQQAQSTASAQRAEQQLAGLLGANIADPSGSNPDGTFNSEVINFDQSGFGSGDITGDGFIPGIPGTQGGNDNIALEAIGYLDLQPGVYVIGGVSDDSLRLSVGSDPRDLTTSLRLADTALGRVQTTVIVQAAGIYPLRALYTETVGAAHLEIWNVDSMGNKILLNDRFSAGGISVYPTRNTGFSTSPYVSYANPEPGQINVSPATKIELRVTDDGTTVNTATVKLSINGGLVALPSGAVTKVGNVTTITLQPAFQLSANSLQTIKLEFNDSAANAIVRQYSFTTGKATPQGGVLNTVKGYWTFDKGNLNASVGRDLRYLDNSVTNLYAFGTTGQGAFSAIPSINGKPAKVIHVPFTGGADAQDPTAKLLGLKMFHGIPPNGGGTKVNQWTMVMDVLWGDAARIGFGAVFRTTNLGTPGDADMFWRASSFSYGKSCCSAYAGIDPAHTHPRNAWARIVFTVDLAATPRVVGKYVDGFKHTTAVTSNGDALDSRFSLPPEFELFSDEDNERTECYVNAIQIREGRMTDEEIQALGGPDASGIPLPYSQWEFEDPAAPLAAKVGNDLQYINETVTNLYELGTTGQGNFTTVPGINGTPVRALHIPFTGGADAQDPTAKLLGLKMNHGILPNGGGTKVNQWTMVMDMLWGDAARIGFGAVFRTTNLGTPGDADMFWRASSFSYGKSCCSAYAGIDPTHTHLRNEWARVVFAVDLSATPRVVGKYINGFKHTTTVTSNGDALDSRFSLPPEFELFSDEDNERTECWISSLQIRQGRMSDEDIAALGGPTPQGIPTPNPVKGEWNFDAGNLKATIGEDLRYLDNSVTNLYQFGTTGQGALAAIPNINGQPAKVIHVPFTGGADAQDATAKLLGLKMLHGIAPNGGGTKVNQWTMVMDMLWGDAARIGFGAVFRTTNLGTPGDADMFWRASSFSYGKSCCSAYAGIDPTHTHPRNAWARIVFTVDLAATPRVVGKFVNGFKHTTTVTSNGDALDSRFSLPPEFELFSDEDNERTECYVNAIQIREGRMTDEDIAALGGPDANGIPSAPAGGGFVIVPRPKFNNPMVSGGQLTLTWTGTGALQESTNLVNWAVVPGNPTSPYVISTSLAASKYYRLQQ